MFALRRFAPIVLAPICITLPARANGRFPEAQQIETVPGSDGSTVFLRATFGVLVSRDAGKSWRWICERALGYEGTWDPPIAVTRDGRLWVGLEGGLLSTKDGCEVDRAAELEGETLKDLATDEKGETLFAITGAPGKKSWVWRRAPSSRFERLAGMDDMNLMTIEVAPGDASRVYLSGQPYSTIRGELHRSDDGGRTFVGKANALEADGPFFIGAVDPKDKSRILVRHLHAKGSDLLLSTDAGKTFKNVLSMTSAMYGFTKSHDRKTYFAGSGLADHGLFRSVDRGETFELASKSGVLCLHGAPGGRLLVCQNALGLGAHAVGLSLDRGESIQPLARFADVEGPVACSGADARASLCASSWPETHALLSPRDAGPPEARLARADAGAASQAPPPRRSSCGCDVRGRPTSPQDRLLIIAGFVALAVRALSRTKPGSRLTQTGPRTNPSARRARPLRRSFAKMLFLTGLVTERLRAVRRWRRSK